MAERIYREQFNDLLQKIPDLSPKERAHLDQAFSSHLVDGLTAYELKEKLDSIHYHQPHAFGSEAYLDQGELDQVKHKMLSALNAHHQ